MDLPRTKEEQMELLDDIKYAKKATKRLGKALRRLRRHNWDKGKGQPGWCTVETTTAENEFRTMSAGEEFVGLIENVGPAQSEVEVVMPWMRDFRSTGGLECTASNDSRRIAFTFPPAVYQEEDGHMMRFLDELAAELAPSEMDRLVDPQGKMITGAKQMAGSFRRRQDSRDAVSKSSYRVRDVDPRVGVAEGPVNRILDAVSAITHGSSPAAFAAAGVNRATGVVTRDQAIEVINSDDAEEEQRLRELGAVDDETEDTAEEQEAAGYSRNCEYMVPLTGETFTFWNAEWKASKMGPTYLEEHWCRLRTQYGAAARVYSVDTSGGRAGCETDGIHACAGSYVRSPSFFGGRIHICGGTIPFETSACQLRALPRSVPVGGARAGADDAHS